jgi:hypothetical protein
MARTPNCEGAQEFQIHDQGGPFGFMIADVQDYKSANCPPDLHCDMLKFVLKPIDCREGRSQFWAFVNLSPKSYMLKMLCIACGLDPKGGFDSEDFIGKVFQAEVIHNQSKKTGNIFPNLVPKTIAPFDGEIEDDDMPF